MDIGETEVASFVFEDEFFWASVGGRLELPLKSILIHCGSMIVRLLLILQCAVIAGPLDDAAVALGHQYAMAQEKAEEGLLQSGADSLIILDMLVSSRVSEVKVRAPVNTREIELKLHFEMSEELATKL